MIWNVYNYCYFTEILCKFDVFNLDSLLQFCKFIFTSETRKNIFCRIWRSLWLPRPLANNSENGCRTFIKIFRYFILKEIFIEMLVIICCQIKQFKSDHMPGLANKNEKMHAIIKKSWKSRKKSKGFHTLPTSINYVHLFRSPPPPSRSYEKI